MNNGIDHYSEIMAQLYKLEQQHQKFLEDLSGISEIVEELRALRHDLIDTLQGRVPSGFIPIETHNKVIRSTILTQGFILVGGLALLRVLGSTEVINAITGYLGK